MALDARAALRRTLIRINKLALMIVALTTGSHILGCFRLGSGHPHSGTVSGYLKSSLGEPLESVVIQFVDDDTGLGVALTTDAKGYFSGSGVSAGTYRVAVRPTAIDVTKGPVTKESIADKLAALEGKVQAKFLSPRTSGITVVLKSGKNRVDLDLSKL